VAFAGWGLLSGRTWARVVAITLAVLSAIANFLWLPYYPFWSLLIIAVASPTIRRPRCCWLRMFASRRARGAPPAASLRAPTAAAGSTSRRVVLADVTAAGRRGVAFACAAVQVCLARRLAAC
jgi:hypothetical protein